MSTLKLASDHTGGLPLSETARVIGDARGDYRSSRLVAYARALSQHAMLPGLRQRLGRFLMQRESFVRHALIDQFFLHRRQPASRACA